MKATNLDYFRLLDECECPDSSFHPSANPLVLDKAKGSIVWDVEGREYIDLCAGFGALSLGHNSEAFSELWSGFQKDRPEIIHGLGDVYPSRAKIDLLESLREILPPFLTRTALTLSGSQAVEVAMKTAILKSGRPGFIAFKGAYHGLDIGALNLTHRQDFRSPFRSWLRDDYVAFLDFNSEQALLEKQFFQAIKHQKTLGGTAAVIVEPIQGRAGNQKASETWLSTLKQLCLKCDALLIFDEVFTGLGRCGLTTFAERYECDLVCLGKALGGGFPLSACIGKESVMSAWKKNQGEAIHTGTFFGHPLSCRAGLITLQEIYRQDLVSRSLKLEKHIRERLSHIDGVTIEGQGLMLALHFNQPGFGVELMNRLRAVGLIAIPSRQDGSCLSLTPALNIELELLDCALEKLLSQVL